jgi:hypothetical protein
MEVPGCMANEICKILFEEGLSILSQSSSLASFCHLQWDGSSSCQRYCNGPSNEVDALDNRGLRWIWHRRVATRRPRRVFNSELLN